jgi:hypothetical protein
LSKRWFAGLEAELGPASRQNPSLLRTLARGWGEREQKRESFMAQGGGYSVQAFLDAADSGSDGNSLDGESQDTVGFDANGGSRALEISSAHAQIAALQSQNAKLQRDNDEAETEAAAAKLKVSA